MTPFPQEPDMPPTSESPPGPDGGVRPPLRERIWTRIEHEVDTRSIRLAADLIRRTEGRVGRLFRRRVLVLTTQGRKSGQMRTVPLQYLDASAPSSRTHRLSSSPPIATTSRCWPPSLPERSDISPKTPVATTSVARSPPPGAVKPCSTRECTPESFSSLNDNPPDPQTARCRTGSPSVKQRSSPTSRAGCPTRRLPPACSSARRP